MQPVILSIIFIIVLEGILILSIYLLDRKKILNNLHPIMTLNSDYLDYMWAPILFYFSSLILTTIKLQDLDKSGNLPSIISFILALIGTLIVVLLKLKRYYFTDKGLIVINLATNDMKEIPFEKVTRIGIKKLARNSLYFIEYNGRQINFSRNILADEKKFKAIFKEKGIDYYVYSIVTGTYSKQN